jgi:hypothetical protein
VRDRFESPAPFAVAKLAAITTNSGVVVFRTRRPACVLLNRLLHIQFSEPGTDPGHTRTTRLGRIVAEGVWAAAEGAENARIATGVAAHISTDQDGVHGSSVEEPR